MATPMLRAVRRHFPPPARLVGILRPNLSEILAGTAWLDEQWHFDPRADQSEARPHRAHPANAAKTLRDGNPADQLSADRAYHLDGGVPGTDRLRPLRPRSTVDRQTLSATAGGRPGRRADGRLLPGAGSRRGLPTRIAPAGTLQYPGRRAACRAESGGSWACGPTGGW